MALIDLLLSGKSKLGYSGKQPIFNSETKNSTLHFNYSLDGTPNLKGYPKPTQLGTSFKTTTPKLYSSNPPK